MNHSGVVVSLLVLGAFTMPPSVESATRCLLDDYDASERPDTTKPTDVMIGLFVIDLVGVDDVAQSFTADLIAWLEWEDPRLGRAVETRRRVAVSVSHRGRLVSGDRSLQPT